MVDGQDIATKHPRLATDRFRHCSDICRILSPRLGISIGERSDRAWHKVREQFHSDDFDLVPLCVNMAALTSSQIAGDVRLVWYASESDLGLHLANASLSFPAQSLSAVILCSCGITC